VFHPIDLSVESREKDGKALYDAALESIQRTQVALKYPTATVKESPNAVLRRLCDFTVIHRPVATIPGLPTNFTEQFDLDIIRVATGGTYEDPGRNIGKAGAVSVRIVEAETVEQAAVYAFELARRTGRTVTSASKYTIQRITDGLFERVIDQVAESYQGVQRRKELFDALLAKIIISPRDYEIILVLNEYGDFLSDMACGLAGSIGIGASGSFSFDDRFKVKLAMFDPSGGTAPDIAGQDKANPTAVFLAFSMLLHEIGANACAEALKTANMNLLHEGETTADLGGSLSLSAFTGRIIERARESLAGKR
jgi:isocitrate dehydrogenase (NAD+)